MEYYIYVIAGILLIPAMIYGIIAQANVSKTFNAFSTITNKGDLTGSEVAKRMLESAGITDVKISKIKGNLTDNYNPKNKTLNLSEATFSAKSVSAIGVAAHEVGHAIQHHTGYRALKLRNKFVPIVNFASRMAIPLLLIGIILTSLSLISALAGQIIVWIAIAFYGSSTLFYLITVKVEYDASKRAMKNLETLGLLDKEELPMADKVLKAAAQTYLSSLIISAIYFLRFAVYIFMIFGNSKD